MPGPGFNVLERLEREPEGEEALRDACFYLLRIDHSGERFLTYGMSVNFRKRLRTYRRALDNVEEVATWQSTQLRCARAERFMQWRFPGIVHPPQFEIPCEGLATESVWDIPVAELGWRWALKETSAPLWHMSFVDQVRS